MSEYIKIILKITWAVVILYWLISALNNKQVTQKESVVKSFLSYWAPIMISILLLGPGDWFGRTWLREKFLSHTDTVGLIGLFFCISGAIVACWSRYVLGKNWSLSVQQKKDHELIEAGPYKLIRHPIYTGLILLFFGHAIIVGDYRAIIAVVIVFISLWLKSKKEEVWLSNLFGEKYSAYRKRTYALIPKVL